jgi:hypothetical protein
VLNHISEKPIKLVADIHSHGKYLFGYFSNLHSSTDKKLNFENHVPGYVATPSGKLRRYDPNKRQWLTGKVTIVSKSLPYDQRYRLLK